MNKCPDQKECLEIAKTYPIDHSERNKIIEKIKTCNYENYKKCFKHKKRKKNGNKKKISGIRKEQNKKD